MCYIVADNIDFMDYRIFNNANDLAYQTKKNTNTTISRN